LRILAIIEQLFVLKISRQAAPVSVTDQNHRQFGRDVSAGTILARCSRKKPTAARRKSHGRGSQSAEVIRTTLSMAQTNNIVGHHAERGEDAIHHLD